MPSRGEDPNELSPNHQAAITSRDDPDFLSGRAGRNCLRRPRASKAGYRFLTAEVSPFDTLRARRLIEGETAALAARNASAAEVAAIERAFARLEALLRERG
jgi:hypothetical protein